jgi:biopolymer transport protein ExbD
MAELDVSAGGHKKGRGVRKGKKLSTRVDLTPMVDLGFLLITFFIFTTTMSTPKALELHQPHPGPPTEYAGSNVITLLLGNKDKVFYYEGADPSIMKETDYRGIRTIVLDKKRRTDTTFFQVILKPTKEATYKNTVAVLDEMLIDDIKHYALVDIDPNEYILLRQQPGQQ